MVAYKLARQIHKWLSLFASVPLVVIFATGILLSISPKVSMLQPEAKKSSAEGLSISFDQILAAAKTVKEAEIESWANVVQLDVRPSAGVVRVRAKNYWEVQIDGHTGAVLSSAPRWKTFLILLHDGSWFGSWVKFSVFFPVGVIALVLWISGLMLWAIPALKKRSKR